MATFPGYDLYGGATITRVVDGSKAEWIGCCGKHNGVFGFYVFKNGVNVPLTPFCTGRGSINQDGHWIAWDGSQYFTGALPGFVPLASGGARAPVPIPPNGAIDNLWPFPYSAAECDTPTKVAEKFTKSNAAVLELVELLKQAGVLI